MLSLKLIYVKRNFYGEIFLFGCFLAAAKELMQRSAASETQKHPLDSLRSLGTSQNRLMPWWSFAPKKNFFFSFCPL